MFLLTPLPLLMLKLSSNFRVRLKSIPLPVLLPKLTAFSPHLVDKSLPSHFPPPCLAQGCAWKLKPRQACLAGAKAEEETQPPPETLPETRPEECSGSPSPVLWLPTAAASRRRTQSLGNAGRRRKGRGGPEQTGGPPAQAPHWEPHSSQWWSPSYAVAEALSPCCTSEKVSQLEASL
ncbi:unnamed protein product [Rangifer tarandus platyrhynchus]|uniref:Uncharacterized protein n=1 Tax=Rangifer tarandus platyrhynchus TaxID=3082113 RepID=A0AC59Z8X5_RANTA